MFKRSDRFWNLFKKSYKAVDVSLFFSSNEFFWDYNNLMKIYNQMDDVDKKVPNTSSTLYTQYSIFTIN
jgi:hypothetical protein